MFLYRPKRVLRNPEGCGCQDLWQSAQECEKVVSPNHRPSLPTLSLSKGQGEAGRIRSMKNHKDPTGNETCDLPSSTAEPQPIV
jgi:hypothetical protein